MLVAAAMVFTAFGNINLGSEKRNLQLHILLRPLPIQISHLEIICKRLRGGIISIGLRIFPENYQLIDTIESKDNLTQIYANPAQPNLPQILFMQYKNAPDALSLNTEKAERHSVTIGESNAEHIFDGEQNILVWQADNLYFVLSTSLDYDTALAAATSFIR